MGSNVFGCESSWSAAAVDVEVIQEQEEEEVPRLYCLPGQLERATMGVPGHSTLATELEFFSRRSAVHAPVVRYTFRDCLVHPHGVEFSGGSIRKSSARFQRVPLGPIKDISQAAYCMSAVAHRYFGHWLQDACATAILARPEEALLLDVRKDWPHAREYVNAFELQPDTVANACVRELSVFQDFSQGSSKRQRYATLRARATRHFGPPTPIARPLYLRRGNMGVARVVLNEEEVVQRLEREGFQVLDGENLSGAEIYRMASAAPQVVSMDGSHLNHLYFSMRPGTSLLTFIQSDRLTATNFGYAIAAGIHFGVQVVDRRGDGYVVDIDAMMRTLELFPA